MGNDAIIRVGKGDRRRFMEFKKELGEELKRKVYTKEFFGMLVDNWERDETDRLLLEGVDLDEVEDNDDELFIDE